MLDLQLGYYVVIREAAHKSGAFQAVSLGRTRTFTDLSELELSVKDDAIMWSDEPSAHIEGKSMAMLRDVRRIPAILPVRRHAEMRLLYKDLMSPVSVGRAMSYRTSYEGDNRSNTLLYGAVVVQPRHTVPIFEAAAWQQKLEAYHDFVTMDGTPS